MWLFTWSLVFDPPPAWKRRNNEHVVISNSSWNHTAWLLRNGKLSSISRNCGARNSHKWFITATEVDMKKNACAYLGREKIIFQFHLLTY